MAFKFPNKIIFLFTIIVYTTTKLNSQPVAEFIPLQPSKELQKCYSQIANPKCLLQIYGSLFNGQFKAISPTCCNATLEVTNACWSILFPFQPFFPPLLKTICGHSNGLVVPSHNKIGYLNISKDVLEGAGLLPYQQNDQYVCFSGLEKCITGFYKSIFLGDYRYLTVGCCKAIIGDKIDCLLKLIPFSPFAPSWLQSVCGKKIGYHHIQDETKITIPKMLPMQFGPKIAKCWSQLINDEMCLVGIYGALSGNGFRFLGSNCCEAVTKINHECWNMIFPMNPLFPEFLQSFCAGGGVLAPAPQ